MNGRPKGSKNKRFHKWTDNQREFLKNNVKGITTPELTKMFNEEFETEFYDVGDGVSVSRRKSND